jgi:hypothetical protein
MPEKKKNLAGYTYRSLRAMSLSPGFRHIYEVYADTYGSSDPGNLGISIEY